MQYTILPNMTGQALKFRPVPMKGSQVDYRFLREMPKRGVALIQCGDRPVNHVRRAIQIATAKHNCPRNTSRVDNTLVVW